MNGESSPTATAETRKLAAIMFTDMVGFSRQMGANEARTLQLLDTHNRIIQQAVAEHHDEVHKQPSPIKDPATLERQLTALRKAGLQ
jgi:class 3 adenylate cyclase